MARALLIIDIQNDYFPGGVLPLYQAEEVETRIVEAIVRAKAAGDRILLVQHISPLKEGLFASGSSGAEIRPAILDAAGAVPVVIKQFADAFQDTELASHLEGIDELLICGMMTQNCVAFTAMSDDARPYRVRVVEELCAAPSEMVHRIALKALASKRDVSRVAELWP